MRERRPILAPGPRLEPVTPGDRPPVPVTLLTGFLGAGKTTLLNHILGGQHGLRIGVLVNDFGAINIDASLVESVEENTISLANGCICCEIRDDLVISLEELLTRTDAIDYIILEASGIADPEGVVMTFLDARYAQLLRLDSIICLVDAEAIFSQGDDDRLNQLKLRQIAFSDLVVLNKTDTVTPAHIEVIRDWIDAHIKRIRIIEANRGDVPLDVLLGVGRFDPVNLPRHEGERETPHSSGGPGAWLDRWSYRTEELFSKDALRRMVQRELPASVYRCKGIVFTDGEPDRPFALQLVGRRTELVPISDERPRGTQSQIVAIGHDFDPNQLNRLFAACHSAKP